MRIFCASLLLLCLLLSGCTRHIYPYQAKKRDYKLADYADLDANRTAGSLWSEGSTGLFEDARAHRVGDIVTIKVEEESDASRDALTATQRASETSFGVSAFLTAMQTLVAQNPGLDPSALIAQSNAAEFEGGGTTARSGKFTAILPVRIVKHLPNGDFYVEGSKVLLLNDEESHLYLSGVIRPIDIDPDNSVSSTKLADVELEYTGRGVVSERNAPGWFSRVLDYVWPF